MGRAMPGVFILIALAFPALAQPAPQRISLDEFRKMHATAKVLVIDVRDERGFANGHIPGAVNVPLGSEESNVLRLKSEKRPIVTYCA
jgi:rhodanese-related sulfurtransferase